MVYQNIFGVYGDCPKLLSIRGPILGSYYNTGPYIHFPHFGNSNLGKLPYTIRVAGGGGGNFG